MEPQSPPNERGKFQRVAEGILQYEPSGRYFARFRHKGKRVFEGLGTEQRPCTTLPEAKRLLRELKNRLDRTDVESRRLTLHDVIRRHREVLGGEVGTRTYKLSYLKKLQDHFPASRLIKDITAHELEVFLGKFKHLAPATQNHIITVMREVFHRALVKLRAIDVSPMEPITYRRVPEVDRRLTPSWQEFRDIVADIRAQAFATHRSESADLVEFMGLAGLGQGECKGLLWGHINFNRQVISIIRQKTKTQFEVPIYGTVRPLLERMDAERVDRDPQSRVFGIDNPKRALEAACRRLGLPHYTARSLRRMFIANARRQKIPVQAIAKWQGHRDVKMIMRVYDKVNDEESIVLGTGLMAPATKAL